MSNNEEVLSYTIDATLGQAYAIVGVRGPDGAVESNRGVVLGSRGYNMLMEKNPKWSPNKPERNFRMDDLLAVVDIIEASKK